MTQSPTFYSENDYEINIRDYSTGNYISLGSGEYCSVRFDGVGSPDLRESVFDISGGDGVMFGTEYFGMINWTITGAVHSAMNGQVAGSSAGAWDAWSTLSRVWTRYPERKIPRAVVPLYFKRPGREQMVVFGRPNRIDPETTQSYVGFIAYTATFRQSDPLFYSSQIQQVTVGMDAPYTGGLLLTDTQDALWLPFKTTEGSAKSASVPNQGDSSSNPKVTFIGPVSYPQLTLINSMSQRQWIIRLNAIIPAGLQVTIDTRSWERSIVDTQGRSWAGSYIGDKLQDIVVPPGINTIEYQGTDQTGTSLARVEYRNAWASL